jgi:hypothetical protein
MGDSTPSAKLLSIDQPQVVPKIKHLREWSKRRDTVLNRLELEEVQTDIAKIMVPSWFTKIQPSFGDLSNGKLKADEWRSLFTVYLPMTLMRLWADSKDHRLHLKTLLLLSIIVNITCSTTISNELVECYDNAIRLYLQLLTACNEDSLVPNHHFALHLSKFMKLFGPCRGQWAFPFERLIGKLQRIPISPSIGRNKHLKVDTR